MAKRKKRRRVFKVRNILIFIIIVLFIISVILYFLYRPVKNIYVLGNKILSDEVIIEESGLDDYPSFLLTFSYDIKKNLSKNKYIENVSVKKKFGNVIEINVKEYKILGINESDKTLILSSGEIVDNSYSVMDVPVLSNSIDDKIFKQFVKKFSEIDSDILRQISQIEYSPVEVDEARFLLYMNDGNLVYVTLTKISKINKYNSIKDKMDNKTGIIYLDSGDYIELKDNKIKNDNNSLNIDVNG